MYYLNSNGKIVLFTKFSDFEQLQAFRYVPRPTSYSSKLDLIPNMDDNLGYYLNSPLMSIELYSLLFEWYIDNTLKRDYRAVRLNLNRWVFQLFLHASKTNDKYIKQTYKQIVGREEHISAFHFNMPEYIPIIAEVKHDGLRLLLYKWAAIFLIRLYAGRSTFDEWYGKFRMDERCEKEYKRLIGYLNSDVHKDCCDIVRLYVKVKRHIILHYDNLAELDSVFIRYINTIYRGTVLIKTYKDVFNKKILRSAFDVEEHTYDYTIIAQIARDFSFNCEDMDGSQLYEGTQRVGSQDIDEKYIGPRDQKIKKIYKKMVNIIRKADDAIYRLAKKELSKYSPYTLKHLEEIRIQKNLMRYVDRREFIRLKMRVKK